jgi:hypothetical protein
MNRFAITTRKKNNSSNPAEDCQSFRQPVSLEPSQYGGYKTLDTENRTIKLKDHSKNCTEPCLDENPSQFWCSGLNRDEELIIFLQKIFIEQ